MKTVRTSRNFAFLSKVVVLNNEILLIEDDTFLSFVFLSAVFFFCYPFCSLAFVLVLLLVSIRFQFCLPFCPNKFSSFNYSFQTYISSQQIFELNQTFTYLGLTEYNYLFFFVIDNVILFDFVLNFVTRTVSQIYVCIDLNIVAIFTHNIFIFVFIYFHRISFVKATI